MPSAIFLDWKLPHYVALRFEQRALKVRKFQREIVVPLILLKNEKIKIIPYISVEAYKKWKKSKGILLKFKYSKTAKKYLNFIN